MHPQLIKAGRGGAGLFNLFLSSPKAVFFSSDNAIFPVLFLLFSAYLSFLICEIEVIIPNGDTATKIKRYNICKGTVQKCRLLF